MLRQESSTFSALELKVKSDEARALLQAGALSVAAVSDRLGFSSQSAFTWFFKLHHHVPPAQYRQNAAPAGR
ncbi:MULTISPECIES: helix-turn-helix domain-containing protein [unclassified Janthinobacterium]|uniref:helix-turn-helix domain-containing protein n=1 Tax=unclassified Janthinobacterium TaxID=2610881 RepID=UPI0003452A23|nr:MULTISPECIES: helix-turn-helix domain-containing protein [unclassified Janthinobacterium]MEC5163833.1 AraC-like DNA-binding protein [Janthinobacterium sp. CG_S6]